MEHRVMSARVYNFTIGLVLFYGFAVNALICTNAKCVEFFMGMNTAVFIIGYFVICLIGIFLSAICGAFGSFVGYNLVVIPVGALLSVCLPEYSKSVILNAIYCTVALTVIFMVLGTLFPNFFLSLGRVLFVSLGIVIIIEIIFIITGVFQTIWWHWLVCGIFCLYVGFDWANAQHQEHTLDNVIDACVSLYLDIINIFMRVLGASPRKGDD